MLKFPEAHLPLIAKMSYMVLLHRLLVCLLFIYQLSLSLSLSNTLSHLLYLSFSFSLSNHSHTRLRNTQTHKHKHTLFLQHFSVYNSSFFSRPVKQNNQFIGFCHSTITNNKNDKSLIEFFARRKHLSRLDRRDLLSRRKRSRFFKIADVIKS